MNSAERIAFLMAVCAACNGIFIRAADTDAGQSGASEKIEEIKGFEQGQVTVQNQSAALVQRLKELEQALLDNKIDDGQLQELGKILQQLERMN
jgi:hypothetical protein